MLLLICSERIKCLVDPTCNGGGWHYEILINYKGHYFIFHNYLPYALMNDMCVLSALKEQIL